MIALYFGKRAEDRENNYDTMEHNWRTINTAYFKAEIRMGSWTSNYLPPLLLEKGWAQLIITVQFITIGAQCIAFIPRLKFQLAGPVSLAVSSQYLVNGMR